MLSTLFVTLPLVLALGSSAPTLATRETTAESITAPEALDTTVWAMARAAYVKARAKGVAQREFLVVIDYSRPSAEKRLWVVNMRNGELVSRLHVAHGRGSGNDRPIRFSNRINSNASSLGVFVTGESYWGQHGRALRLDGLEPGVNDKARVRNVVFHGSDYVSEDLAERSGRVGRSLGCPAVDAHEARRLVPILEGGAVVFAWYPETKWLKKSRWIPDAIRAAFLPRSAKPAVPSKAVHTRRATTRRAAG